MGIVTYSIECNNDETLMNVLGVSKKVIKHSGNKTRVLKYLLKNEDAIGMVDEDPESYQVDLSNYDFIKNFPTEIDLYKKKNSTDLLIVLKPELEPWILKASRIAKLNLKDYNLPEDAKKFKIIMAHKNRDVMKFLKDLNEKSEYFSQLRKILHSELKIENII